MEITKTTPEEFIASLPIERGEVIAQIDKLITKIAPDAVRVMWEGKFWGGSEQKIIGYGHFSYRGSSKKEVNWFMVGLAAQKNYTTVFVNAVEAGEYLAEKYKPQLGKKVKVGKSSISFAKLADIDLEVLSKLIAKALR